jgi:hypothetical protein
MNVKIMGADQSVTNVSGNNYTATLQASAVKCKLFKLTISPLAGMAADVYVWAFDLAAGAASSAAPVSFRLAPTGYVDTWDLGEGGALFTNGLYLACSTVAPTDATTTVTDSGANKVILKADIRKL